MQAPRAFSSIQGHAMIELCILETHRAGPTRLAVFKPDSGNSSSGQELEIVNLYTHLSCHLA